MILGRNYKQTDLKNEQIESFVGNCFKEIEWKLGETKEKTEEQISSYKVCSLIAAMYFDAAETIHWKHFNKISRMKTIKFETIKTERKLFGNDFDCILLLFTFISIFNQMVEKCERANLSGSSNRKWICSLRNFTLSRKIYSTQLWCEYVRRTKTDWQCKNYVRFNGLFFCEIMEITYENRNIFLASAHAKRNANVKWNFIEKTLPTIERKKTHTHKRNNFIAISLIGNCLGKRRTSQRQFMVGL